MRAMNVQEKLSGIVMEHRAFTLALMALIIQNGGHLVVTTEARDALGAMGVDNFHISGDVDADGNYEFVLVPRDAEEAA